MQRGVDVEKVFGRQEGKDPRTYFEPRHLLGLFRFRLHHAHRSELGVLLESDLSISPRGSHWILNHAGQT
jgi:hypothetical protein